MLKSKSMFLAPPRWLELPRYKLLLTNYNLFKLVYKVVLKNLHHLLLCFH